MTKRMGGEPYILDSADFSTTRRKRAWWTRNLTMDIDLLTPPSKRPNPDDCMDRGRTLVRRDYQGRKLVRTITAAWRGGNDPVADTNFPVLVIDAAKEARQHLRPHEGEKLHSLPLGCTAEPSTHAAARLHFIGGGWDAAVAKLFFQQYRRTLVKRAMKANMKAIKDPDLKAIMKLIINYPMKSICRLISKLPAKEQDYTAEAFKEAHTALHAPAVASADAPQSTEHTPPAAVVVGTAAVARASAHFKTKTAPPGWKWVTVMRSPGGFTNPYFCTT